MFRYSYHVSDSWWLDHGKRRNELSRQLLCYHASVIFGMHLSLAVMQPICIYWKVASKMCVFFKRCKFISAVLGTSCTRKLHIIQTFSQRREACNYYRTAFIRFLKIPEHNRMNRTKHPEFPGPNTCDHLTFVLHSAFFWEREGKRIRTRAGTTQDYH